MTNLEGAKCAGRFSLFDSPTITDHIEARRLCDTCPATLACHALLLEVLADCSGGLAGAPGGTWAGQLYKQGRRVRVPKGLEVAS